MDSFARTRQLIFDSEEDEDLPGYSGRRPRWVRSRENHFHDLDDRDFARRFRLSKSSARSVLEMIDHHLEFPTDKNDAVSPINQLLLCLRYYATGSTQLSCGDFSGVSEPTAHRIIHRVSANLAALARENIYFPRNEVEVELAKLDFFRIAMFPRVVGAVDGTHVKIRSPGGEHAEYYRNRKGYFSLNCQAICNANLEILDLVARWPGSTHDQTVFDQSRIRARFEEGEFGESIILGDSAYANKSYLMTPLDNPATPLEALYNESQIRTRNPVERLFGVWKRRFPVLAIGINVKLPSVMPIISATAVLHNMLIRSRDPLPPRDPDVAVPMPWEELLEYGQMNPPPAPQETRHSRNDAIRARYRREMINNYFHVLQLRRLPN